MNLGKAFWLKVSVESALIVFSVLLALFLNTYWASSKEEEKTRLVLHSIREELRQNEAIVEQWQKNHQQVLRNIIAFRESGTSSDSLVQNNQFRFELLFNETLVPDILRSTAWETAKTTGLVQNFDLELANTLSDVYDLQRLGPMRTIERIVDLVAQRETHQVAHAPQTLVLLHFALNELVGQENILLEGYEQAIKELDAHLEE